MPERAGKRHNLVTAKPDPPIAAGLIPKSCARCGGTLLVSNF